MATVEKTEIEVTYDKWGRMQYHPDFHANHGTPWTAIDEQFLIENYEKIGPEETSFALERTLHTCMAKAWWLRKHGKMPKRTAKRAHKRMKPGDIK